MDTYPLYVWSILFMIGFMLFIAVIVLVTKFKNWAVKRDAERDQRLDSLEALMLIQFKEILDTLKN